MLAKRISFKNANPFLDIGAGLGSKVRPFVMCTNLIGYCEWEIEILIL